MDQCANHSNNVAIENCELCDRPLCALCLWYAADGRRLCEEHAGELQEQGDQIYSPAIYSEAVLNTLTATQKQADAGDAGATYKGNTPDLNALIAAVLALTALFSCCGGIYCLPMIALALGAFAYANADKAFDPARTRRLAGIGLGAGALMVAAAFAFVVLYVVLILFAIVANPGP